MSSARTPSGPFSTGLTLRLIIVAAIGWQVVALLTAPPGMDLTPHANLNVFKAAAIAQAAIVAMGAAGLERLARLWFPALLFVLSLLGGWILIASPPPTSTSSSIARAIDALLQGHNPYAITFQDTYGANSGFYFFVVGTLCCAIAADPTLLDTGTRCDHDWRR